MKAVRTGFDGGIDDSTAAPSELGRVVTGLDFEFLDRVHVGLQNIGAVIVGVVIDAVQYEIVQKATRAVDCEAATCVSVGGGSSPTGQSVPTFRKLYDPRCQ